MPPEAGDQRIGFKRYDSMLDVFSFGYLALFTASQEFPLELLPHTYTTRCGALCARTEVDRQQQ